MFRFYLNVITLVLLAGLYLTVALTYLTSLKRLPAVILFANKDIATSKIDRNTSDRLHHDLGFGLYWALHSPFGAAFLDYMADWTLHGRRQ
jgi:hypothetical protein